MGRVVSVTELYIFTARVVGSRAQEAQAALAGIRHRIAPAHYLSVELLLAGLGREYLFTGVAHTLMESLASKNAARLRAMLAADQNIGERLDGLRQSERVRRQDEITTELLDIVTGAEAILGGMRAHT